MILLNYNLIKYELLKFIIAYLLGICIAELITLILKNNLFIKV